jgi:hypothetical protein
VADTQEYLDELYAKRRAAAGVRQLQFSDQLTTFDHEQLEREITRVERALRGRSTTRVAAFRSGV